LNGPQWPQKTFFFEATHLGSQVWCLKEIDLGRPSGNGRNLKIESRAWVLSGAGKKVLTLLLNIACWIRHIGGRPTFAQGIF